MGETPVSGPRDEALGRNLGIEMNGHRRRKFTSFAVSAPSSWFSL